MIVCGHGCVCMHVCVSTCTWQLKYKRHTLQDYLLNSEHHGTARSAGNVCAGNHRLSH